MKKNIEKNKTSNGTSPSISKKIFLQSCGSILIIIVITLLLFRNTLTESFILLDDIDYITYNPFIKSISFNAIADMFSSFRNGNYHPLTTLSYAIEYKLFGLQARPYHTTNLLFHLLNTVLVFLFINKISANRAVSFITSLFFAIHPMHVESVACISERKDVLYVFFFLSGLIFYLKHIEIPGKKNYLFVLLFFLFSLLSKSAAITFPLILILLDYHYKRGLNKKTAFEKLPFFIISLLFALITLYSQKSIGAIQADIMPDYSLVQRFFVVCYAVSYYIVRLLMPFNLSLLHYAPEHLTIYYYLSPAFIILIILFIYKAGKMQRELIFGSLFYLFSIILTLQIIPVGFTVVSERYSYLPYVGLFFIIGTFYTRIRSGKISMPPSFRTTLPFIFSAFSIFLITLTFGRNKNWENSYTIFKDIAEKYPEVADAHFSLGNNLSEMGEIQKAITEYDRAIEIDPGFSQAYYSRGVTLGIQNNNEAALRDFVKAIELKPDYTEAIYNAGVINYILNRPQEAINWYTKAIAHAPKDYLYRERARANALLGKYKEAYEDCKKALAINPNDQETIYNKGLASHNLKMNKEACADWQKASALGYSKANEKLNKFCK